MILAYDGTIGVRIILSISVPFRMPGWTQYLTATQSIGVTGDFVLC